MKRVLFSLFSFSLVGFLAAQAHMADSREMCRRVLLAEGACGAEKELKISPLQVDRPVGGCTTLT